MRRLVVMLIAAALCICAYAAENAITNPNFAERGSRGAAGSSGRPASARTSSPPA